MVAKGPLLQLVATELLNLVGSTVFQHHVSDGPTMLEINLADGDADAAGRV